MDDPALTSWVDVRVQSPPEGVTIQVWSTEHQHDGDDAPGAVFIAFMLEGRFLQADACEVEVPIEVTHWRPMPAGPNVDFDFINETAPGLLFCLCEWMDNRADAFDRQLEGFRLMQESGKLTREQSADLGVYELVTRGRSREARALAASLSGFARGAITALEEKNKR